MSEWGRRWRKKGVDADLKHMHVQFGIPLKLLHKVPFFLKIFTETELGKYLIFSGFLPMSLSKTS